MFFLSHLLRGWNAFAERWARYCSPFVASIMYPLAVARISWMSGHFFSCLRTLRFPLSECFIIYSLTDGVIKSRSKLVSFFDKWERTENSELVSFFVHGCRSRLRPLFVPLGICPYRARTTSANKIASLFLSPFRVVGVDSNASLFSSWGVAYAPSSPPAYRK